MLVCNFQSKNNNGVVKSTLISAASCNVVYLAALSRIIYRLHLWAFTLWSYDLCLSENSVLWGKDVTKVKNYTCIKHGRCSDLFISEEKTCLHPFPFVYVYKPSCFLVLYLYRPFCLLVVYLQRLSCLLVVYPNIQYLLLLINYVVSLVCSIFTHTNTVLFARSLWFDLLREYHWTSQQSEQYPLT